MSLKLYFRYEESSDESLRMTLKMKIPKKWRTGPVQQLLDFFVEHYNAKHEANPLIASEVHFEKDKREIAGDCIVSDVFQHHNDVYICPGKLLTASEKAAIAAETAKANEGLVRCRNYGCQQLFDPNKNEEGSCKHHIKPPIFHDIKKGWSCCGHKMVYDWDAFQAIPGCATGKHSTIPPELAYAPSPTVLAAASAEARSKEVKSIDSYNVANPDAITAASSAATMIKKAKTKPQPKDELGRSKCVNKGCGKYFFPKDNGPRVCKHHPMPPVFHDTRKYYSCCSSNVAYDFDEFLKIEGCSWGSHSDVVLPPPVPPL